MVFSLVFGSLPCLMLFQSAFAAVERPAECETECPARMDARVQPLATSIAEKGTEETERFAAIVNLVAVPEEEPLA